MCCVCFENFDGLTLIEYIEDSYRRYNTNINVRDDIEDWQSAVHDKFTANKVDAILAKVVSVPLHLILRNIGTVPDPEILSFFIKKE